MKKLLIALYFCLFSGWVAAHPHSFIDMKNQVIVENGKLQGFKMTWILDEITSSALLYEIKQSKNKQAAKQKIAEELSQSAVDAHYFSELYDEQKKPIKFKARPKSPRLETENNRVIYQFELSLAQSQDVAKRHFTLFTFEPSYYLYMGYGNESDVTINQQNQCKVSMQEPASNQSLRLYASKLDKTETPDFPMENGLSLGAQFAQKVSVICQ